jgi:hypothetical protein
MRSICSVLAVVLSVFLIAAPRVQAQAHIAGQQVLDAAVSQHVRAADQDRETVRLFLQRGDVRGIAGKYGVDIRRAESAVTALDATELASVAAQARQADQALAGGASTVTISTTTIIIALLVLILVIVAVH